MNYKILKKDVQNIVDFALSNKQESSNLSTTISYWTIGKRLVKDEQQGQSRAAYGREVLALLAKDLNQRYGKGFGVASLKYMRQFYKVYKKTEINANISWSHYRTLVQVKDVKQRRKLEIQIIKSRWSQRQLAEHIGILLGTNIHADKTNKLKRPFGRVGLMQIRRVFKNGRKFIFIDLGFSIWLKSNSPESGEFVNKALMQQIYGSSSQRIRPYAGSRKNLYVYKATLDHVVDGDTVVAIIDCGLDTCIRQSLRLRAVNAVSLTESDGVKAKAALEEIFSEVDEFLIKTSKRDKYARLVADIILPDSAQIAPDTIETGLYLNQELLDRGLAEPA